MKEHARLAIAAWVVVAAMACSCPAATPTPTPTEEPKERPTSTPTEEPTPAGPALGDTWTRPADGMVMVYVPAGEFEMGSTDQEVDYALALCHEYYYGDCRQNQFEEEQPVHTVALDAFWIDRTEVTNAQYAQCVAARACEPPWKSSSYTRDSYYDNPAYDDYPVIYVDRQRAEAYCAWAGGRLPTEAEWEYAARGPEGYIFPWGDELDGTRLNYCDADCEFKHADRSFDDGYADTAPVGSYRDGASWVGALDLAGNVWEWVADWYGEYLSEPQENPIGPSTGEFRMVRGGSWGCIWYTVRAASRSIVPPDYPYYDVGFRCAAAPGE
jgi:formylglycine-generating enzyme required for sulfatase activity